MLGRSYLVSKRFADAVKAYAKANELTNGANPDVLISYGEAKGFAAGNNLMKALWRCLHQSLENKSK